MNDDSLLPRLRPLSIDRVRHQGDEFFLMRDRLQLAGEETLLVPVALGPLLLLLDGRHTVTAALSNLRTQYGLTLEREQILGLMQTLSACYLLEDAAYRSALAELRAGWRSAPHRSPALTDRVYPADRHALGTMLRGWEHQASAYEDGTADGLAGLISPHIDYQRGGPVYGALWRRAAPALREADLVVIFGTDHHGSPGRLTLTRQPYATPWGVLPAAPAAVDAMVDVLGEDEAFAEELHHRDEHSVELAAVWLHHARGGRPVPVVPVLCGHPLGWMQSSERGMADDPSWQTVMAALEALRTATAGKRVIVVAAADLAHVGPAFGDPRPYSPAAKTAVRQADEDLLAACESGPAAVLASAGRTGDRYRICGLSPIALTLAFTGPVRAETVGYDQCPADHDGGDGSIVTIAGTLLRRRGG